MMRIMLFSTIKEVVTRYIQISNYIFVAIILSMVLVYFQWEMQYMCLSNNDFNFKYILHTGLFSSYI